MLKVFDISKHNGVVDFDALLAAGVQGFIIRAGWGSDETSQDDSQFERNVAECERLNLPYGVYLYSYALNKDDAISEATHMLRMISGRNPKLGIWYDMEDADQYKVKKGFPLTTSNGQAYRYFCTTFCNEIRKAGYNNVGIYASKSVFDNILNDEGMYQSGIKRWVAQWNNECTYTRSKLMWQYTDNEVVGGKRFDANYYFGSVENNVRQVSKVSSAPINNTVSDADELIHVTYNAYTKDGWIGEQLDGVEVTKDCAPIRCIMAKLSKGEIFVQVHSIAKNKWYSYVNGYSPADHDKGYAGVGTDDIDAVRIYTKGTGVHDVKYQVFTEDVGWLPIVTEASDYAGILGKRVISIKIYMS